MSVLSAYCALSCCIVYRCVLLFSFTRCAYFWAVFFNVRFCSSTRIWGVVLVLLRFCPHVVSRLCPYFLHWCFVLIFYFEAPALYFIYLRLSPHILYILRLRPRIILRLLIFHFEAPALYFILRLRPHILYWGFVLIFYLEASSSLLYIEAMLLSLRLWSSLL